MGLKIAVRTVFITSVIALTASVHSADLGDVTKLPPPAKAKVDFAKEIKPIIEKTCLRCHGPEKQKSKYRLDSRETAVKGGTSGDAAIIPGNSSNSPLVHYVARLVVDMEMPPEGKTNTPLTKEQVGLFRAWVDQGAKWE